MSRSPSSVLCIHMNFHARRDKKLIVPSVVVSCARVFQGRCQLLSALTDDWRRGGAFRMTMNEIQRISTAAQTTA